MHATSCHTFFGDSLRALGPNSSISGGPRIQKSLHKMLGSGKKGGPGSISTGLSSDQDTKLGFVKDKDPMGFVGIVGNRESMGRFRDFHHVCATQS